MKIMTSLFVIFFAVTSHAGQFPQVECFIETYESPSAGTRGEEDEIVGESELSQEKTVPQHRDLNLKFQGIKAKVFISQGDCATGSPACISMKLKLGEVVSQTEIDLPYSANRVHLSMDSAKKSYSLLCDIDASAPGDWVKFPDQAE